MASGEENWAMITARRIASFLLTLVLTFIGLTAVTFVIGRFTRIDPVLAVVGDKVAVHDNREVQH